MARSYTIYGEHIVKIYSGSTNFTFTETSGQIVELGLTDNITRIQPIFHHQDIHVDDFGNKAPAEVMSMMAECRIEMTLVHYDPTVLSCCLWDAKGFNGIGTDLGFEALNEGACGAAGTLMGGGRDVGHEDNRYSELFLIFPKTDEVTMSQRQPYVFHACYLDSRPLEIPISTERSLVKLSWRAIPYDTFASGSNEIRSSGSIIWSRPPPITYTSGMADPGVLINPNTGLPAILVIAGKIIL